MATQVLSTHETGMLDAPAYSGPLTRLLECVDTEELVESRELSVSTVRALGGARSILVALSIEGGVLLSAFLVWQIFRGMR
jgi:hypothetical protein